MSKLYSLKWRRSIVMFYYINSYSNSIISTYLYSFMRGNNFLSVQCRLWSNVYFNIQNLGLLSRNISWVCLLTGSYRGIFRLFMLSRLAIYNSLLVEDWNNIMGDTN